MSTTNENTKPVTTIEDYLRGSVGYSVTDDALATILFDRGIASGTVISMMERKERELCKADLYMWCASLPKTTASIEDVNGVWKHKEGAIYMSDNDRKYLIKMATAIYKKYGEYVGTSSIKLNVQGMRLWRKG